MAGGRFLMNLFWIFFFIQKKLVAGRCNQIYQFPDTQKQNAKLKENLCVVDFWFIGINRSGHTFRLQCMVPNICACAIDQHIVERRSKHAQCPNA